MTPNHCIRLPKSNERKNNIRYKNREINSRRKMGSSCLLRVVVNLIELVSSERACIHQPLPFKQDLIRFAIFWHAHNSAEDIMYRVTQNSVSYNHICISTYAYLRQFEASNQSTQNAKMVFETTYFCTLFTNKHISRYHPVCALIN